MEKKEKLSSKKINPNKEEWKREKRQQSLWVFNAALLILTFVVIALFMTFGKRPNVSYVENRDLEKLPEFSWESYWSGGFTEQLGKYYNDTVPMRSTWKLAISNFRKLLGIKYAGGITIIGEFPVPAPSPAPATSESPSGASAAAEYSEPEVYIPTDDDESGSSSESSESLANSANSASSSAPESSAPSDTSNRVPEVYIPE